MNKLLLILILFPCFIFGQQTINDSILINGIYRNYITYVPSIYQPSQPTPLIFNLHGRTSTAWQQMWYGDFRDIADTANFIIVHPQGLLDNTGVTHWNLGQSNIDDIGFLNSLYSHLVSNYNINLDQVYSTGMSNGGSMSYYLACNMNDKIAAIASVTGAMGTFTQLNCNPSHPTPVMEIHGTADFTVPFNDIINGIEYWRDYNNCNLIADTTLMPDLNFGDLSTVKHIVYKNGDNGVTTELFKVINGGHTWPGSNISTGVTNYDVNASIEIWKFFYKYDINGLIHQSTSITEYITKKDIIKVIDVLGRQTKHLKNQPLFYIYDDGTVEKKIILE
jgi:polyhydroxybutyrate depolymerase